MDEQKGGAPMGGPADLKYRVSETPEAKLLRQRLHDLREQVPALQRDLTDMRAQLATHNDLLRQLDFSLRTVMELVRDLDRWVRPVLQSIVEARHKAGGRPQDGRRQVMRVTVDEREYDPEHGLDRSRGPRYGPGERFIVKVQLPVGTTAPATAGTGTALVYDQGKRVEYVAGVKESEEVARHVGSRLKSFWYAMQLASGRVELGAIAPWQDW